jgi:hypothetical protein
MPSRTATTPRLLIRSSSIHAAGCYTLDPIPAAAASWSTTVPASPKS